MSTSRSFSNGLVRALRYVYAFSLGVQLIFLAVIAVNTAALQIYTVQGFSMYPTFHTGDHLLVNKLAYAKHPPQVGDIVIFTRGSGQTIFLVKRIRGLPGSVQQMNDGPVTVGADQYFVRGDNPPQSTDSRTFGPIEASTIVGKVVCIGILNVCSI